MGKDWIINPTWPRCEEAARRWRVPTLIAQVLLNRGIGPDDDPGSFLSPQLRDLIPPEQLPGAVPAAERIVEAVRRGERIVLYGDYDVDGMTGVAILWHLLSMAGASVDYYVPHRLEEGYGVNRDSVVELARGGAQLIVSVDCGITAGPAVAAAREAGASFIVTDHHQPGDSVPTDTLIVHPTVGGSYANPNLCGAGVAFKLAWAIAKVLSGSDRTTEEYKTFLQNALALAALGTVADVVELVGENRIIVRHGLALLPTSPFCGIQSLIEAAALNGNKVSSYDVGFKLGPRLNAAGRMGHARLAVELLTRATPDRAREIVLYLEDQNRKRQSTERRITAQAEEMIERGSLASDTRRAIVLADEDWHPGVIGICASRLVDRYHRPVVMISLNGESGQGSGRSIKGFDITDGLRKCRSHLIEFGGHTAAAGLKIEPKNVAAFTECFVDHANQVLTGADMQPRLRIDAEVSLDELDMQTTEALLNLGPFGNGNPKPRFSTDWVELAAEPRLVGATGKHVQAVLVDRDAQMKSIAFGLGDQIEELKNHRRCKVAFEPLINEFRGRRSVEMQIVDFRFPSS